MARFTEALGERARSTIGNFTSGLKSAMFSAAPGIAGIAGIGQSVSRGIRGSSGSRVGGSDPEEQQVKQQIITNRQLDILVSETRKSYATQRDAVQAATQSLQQIKLLREQGAYEHKKLVEAIEESGSGVDGKKPKKSKSTDLAEKAKTFAGTPAGRIAAGAAVLGISAVALTFLARNLLGKRSYGLRKDIGAELTEQNVDGAGMMTTKVGGGTTITKQKSVVEVTDPELAKLTKEQTEAIKDIGINTKEELKLNQTNEKRERLRQTRPKPTRAEKILGDAQARFLKGFEETTTKIFREGLEKLLPAPGVSAATAAGEMYRGQTLRQMTGLDKAASKIFGKDYGPLFAELGTAYLEVGASAVAENLFANVFGADEKGAKKSRIVGGQVLGNIAAGKNNRAAESLIYGLTGIPTGAETLANYMGFDSAKQGVGFVADVLGAATTEFLRPSSFKGAAATYTDPRTGQTFGYGGGFMDILTGKRQGILTPQTEQQKQAQALQAKVTTQPAVTVMHKGQPAAACYIVNTEELRETSSTIAKAVTGGSKQKSTSDLLESVSDLTKTDKVKDATIETAETIHQLYENTDEWGSIHEDTMIGASKADTSTQQQVGTSLMGTFQQVGTFLMSGLDRLGQIFMSRPSGGGTSLNIGGFGGGNFMSMIGNVVGSTAIAYGVNKLTSKIKDPNLRMIANVAGNFAGQKFLMGNLGGIGGTGASLFSQGQALAGVGDYFSRFDIMNPSSYLPGYGGGAASSMAHPDFGGSIVTGGGFDLSNYLSSSYTNLMSGNVAGPVASFQNASTLGKIGQGIGYTYALYQLSQGNVAGAATSAFSTYAFASGNPYLMAAAVVLNVLGIGKKKPKRPVLERAIAIRGNNDPKQIRTIQERHGDMSSMYAGLDAFLLVAFNTLKLIEKKTGQTPFTHVSLYIESGKHTRLSLYRETETNTLVLQSGDKYGSIKYSVDFGNPSDVFKTPGTMANYIVDFITESYKKEVGTSDEAALSKAAQTIRGKSFGELASKVIRELDDLNPEVSDFYGSGGYLQSTFDDLMIKQDELRRSGIVGESGFESAEKIHVTRMVEEMYDDNTTELRPYTTKESVGLVDAMTGQIVPYGTSIKYTDADGTEKTVTLDRDAAGTNKIVALLNGVPVFDHAAFGTAGKFDHQDFVEYGKKYNIQDMTVPSTFLPEEIVANPQTQYNKDRYGEGLPEGLKPPAVVVAPTNTDRSQTININPSITNHGTDGLTFNYNFATAG